MSTFNVDAGAENWEVVSTLNYLLSNLGNAPFGLTINKLNGEILNVGTNTVTGYLYRYINIAWANNIQGLYFSGTSANQAFYGIQNNDSPTYPTSNTSFTWRSIPTPPGAIGPTNGVKLWYSIGGGRTITFAFGTTIPGAGFVQFVDNTPIDLDVITFIGNSSVIGDYWTAGNYGTIGANLTVGANATIGSNLTVGSNFTAANLITNSVLNADTVGTTQLVNLSVTNGKLANNSVTTGKIANYTIIDQDIANLTITGSKIVDYTLAGTKLANAAITSQQVQEYSLIGTDLANLTVTGQQIADYTLVGTKLANATVDTQQITNLAVTNAKLAANAVTSDKIQDYTIVGTDLANATVTSQQIQDYTITATDIANLTITGSQVANYTLVGTKLANATVGSQQITDYSITGTDIANLTITGSQVANSTLDQTKLNIATLSDITANAGNITAGQITGVGQGGTTLITGYTTGITTSLSNVALTNKSATTLSTYTVNTSQPAGTRLVFTLSGTVNHYGNETTNGVYDALAGNVILDVLYSNSAALISSVNFAQGAVTMIRQSSTSYDYRMYISYANSQSQRMANDTYTFKLTPWFFYRNNGTGNLVTPTNDTITFNGRLAIFQANIS